MGFVDLLWYTSELNSREICFKEILSEDVEVSCWRRSWKSYLLTCTNSHRPFRGNFFYHAIISDSHRKSLYRVQILTKTTTTSQFIHHITLFQQHSQFQKCTSSDVSNTFEQLLLLLIYRCGRILLVVVVTF